MPKDAEPHARFPDLQQRCSELGIPLRELGIPLTVQRRAVYAVLAARCDHPTAEQVFADLEAQMPGVSMATAYRTLDKLVELGLVVRVSHPGNAARYDAKTTHHHHQVCNVCGAVADLESSALDALPLPDMTRNGFEPRDYSVHVLGTCQQCLRQKGLRQKGRGRKQTRAPGGQPPAARRADQAPSEPRHRTKPRRKP